MHFEILVEDKSGRTALELIVPHIIGAPNSHRIHSYKGIGRIPKAMTSAKALKNRLLLDNLPRLLKGFDKAYRGIPTTVVVVCDLDDKCRKLFRNELIQLAKSCGVTISVQFCIAVEEFEAWFLGDLRAIRSAYPRAKDSVLDFYSNDSICGTWEKLADAQYAGGSKALKKLGWQAIGYQKGIWAGVIPLHMDVEVNLSPSFVYFRNKLRQLAQ